MKAFFHFRLAGAALAALAALLLSACAAPEAVRGRLTYDLRAESDRGAVFWPAPPEKARYRYLGQLVGQPNFQSTGEDTRSVLSVVFKTIVGLFEADESLRLLRPQHGAVDEAGRVMVVDTGRNAVVVFDPNGPPEDAKKDAKPGEASGQMLFWNFATLDTPFAGPVAMASLGGGEVAVSDAKLGLVARLDASGAPLAAFTSERLKRPTGLAFDAERGWLFVADTAAHDIKVFDRSGQLLNTFGAVGEQSGQFNAPTHLAFSDGKLYVTDTLNSRIQVFDADGRYLSTLGERGLYVGNLARPKGVALDSAGTIYVIESYFGYLLAYNQDGKLLLGISGSGLDKDKFLLPAGVWSDRHGRIFVADMFNGRVVVFQFLGADDA